MLRRVAAVAAAVAALSVLAGVQDAQADTSTVVASDDTYSSQSNPSTRHGGNSSLSVNAAPRERRAYVKFTVTGIPAGATAVTAVLRLRASAASSATLTAWSVSSGWTQTSLTWNNQPALGSPVASRTGLAGGQYEDFDVSSQVTGNGTWALALTSSSATRVRFDSREADSNAPPLLALSWTPPTTTSTSTTTTTVAPTTTTTPPGSDDPVVAAAGDIACAPPANRTSGACHHRDTSNLLVAGGYDAVLPLGDLQYECGQLSAFQSVYDPTWGRVKAITRPAIGDNEYTGTGCSTAGASGYFTYFGDAASPRQPGCRSACPGYYSYDLGSWHIVALNTECNQPGVGGCSSSSAQGRWLAADLAAHPNQCTLAYWHRPRWSESGSLSSSSSYFVQALHDAGADVVLAGHNHFYARFAPQNPSGGADPARGIRQFIVGTGGKSLHGLSGNPDPQVEVRSDGAYGVLELTLHQGSYDWRFVPEAGESFTDAGTAACH
jgi:hypothetical protein